MPRSSLHEWLEHFEHHASGRAYIQPRGYRREVWTYGDVLTLARRFAHELHSRGIGKGDRVVLWGENCAQWVAVFLGCMMRGVVVVPMDRVGSPAFVERVCHDVDAKLLVCSRELLGLVHRPALELDGLAQTVAAQSADPFLESLTRDDPLQIIFTSGTTAEPRGVVTTHGNVLANLEPFEQEIPKYLKYERWVHPIRFLHLVPLSHVFGQFMGIFIPPLLGGTVVFHHRLGPGEIARTIREQRISVLVAVPRVVESLQSHVEQWIGERKSPGWLSRNLAQAQSEKIWWRWWRFRSLHRYLGWKFWAIVCGGATLDATVEDFWSRMSFPVLQGYGLTETTSLVSVNHPFNRSAGSIGRVLPGRDMMLSPSGEILVRGEAIAKNYWREGKLSPVAGEDGWFRTGDLGELDAEGFLHFKGRAKNIIVTVEGMKVYPQDLEAELRAQSEVRDAIVFGLERGGNAQPAAALLMTGGDSDASEVIRRVNKKLAAFQQIRSWYRWPEADFPRTSTQKPKLAEIQAQAILGMSATPGTARPSGNAVTELISLIKKRSDTTNRSGDLDASLDLSSLERVELMCALEERYNVELNETAFAEAAKVSDLEKLVATPATRMKPTDYHYPRWAQLTMVRLIRVLIYYALTFPATYLLSWPKIIGREQLGGLQGPALLVCNHITYLDVGFVLAALPFRMRNRLAVAMEGELLEAMRHPKTGGLMVKATNQLAYWLVTALFNVFPLPKLSGFRESFSFAGDSIDRGFSVLVFPEGLRTRDGAMSPFRRGIGMLATRLNVPVVPMRIDGLWETKKAGWRMLAPWGKIQVRLGKPVSFAAGEDEEGIASALEQRVRAL